MRIDSVRKSPRVTGAGGGRAGEAKKYDMKQMLVKISEIYTQTVMNTGKESEKKSQTRNEGDSKRE